MTVAVKLRPGRPQKMSCVINKHKTSLSLEVKFKVYLFGIAAERGITISQLVEEIESSADRVPDSSLSSACRTFVVDYLASHIPLTAEKLVLDASRCYPDLAKEVNKRPNEFRRQAVGLR